MTNKVKNLLSKYEGKLTETDTFITLISKNNISDNHIPVECRVEIKNSAEPGYFLLNCYEKTCSILGGVGGTFTENELLEQLKIQLKRYNFRRNKK